MLFVVIEGKYDDCVEHMVGLITLLCKSEQLHDSSVLFPDDYFMDRYANEFNQDGRHRLMDLDFISYGIRVDSQRRSKVKSMFAVQYFSYNRRQDFRIHVCDPYTGKKNDPTIIFHLGEPSSSFLTFVEQNQLSYQIIPIIFPKKKKEKEKEEEEDEEDEDDEEGEEEEEEKKKEWNRKFVPPSILMHASLQKYLTSSPPSSSFKKWTVEESLV
jgi:hypothetical protein